MSKFLSPVDLPPLVPAVSPDTMMRLKSLPALPSAQGLKISPESAQQLKGSLRDVGTALLKFAKTLPAVGLAASVLLTVNTMTAPGLSMPERVTAAAVGTAQIASKSLAGVNIDTFVDIAMETRARLADKKFIAATAAVAAGAAEILTDMVAGSLAAHLAREGVRVLARRVVGEENMPNSSETRDALKSSLFLKSTVQGIMAEQKTFKSALQDTVVTAPSPPPKPEVEKQEAEKPVQQVSLARAKPKAKAFGL